MIQSVKFDSPYMDIKKISNFLLTFIIERLIEIIGIIVLFIGVVILIALISYSPEDPNFIFPDNTEIKNLLGFRGSYLSDLFFQSIGLISYLIPFTLFFTGISIFRNKQLLVIIENIFYVIPYCLVGTIFFSYFYKDTFSLFINGNGGFVGNYLNQLIFNNLTISYENFLFYLLIFLVLIFFFLSINFNSKSFFLTVKKLTSLIFKKKEKNYTNKNEIINEYIPQEEIRDLIQEDLPFIKAEKKQTNLKQTYSLPAINFLKTPLKKEKKDTIKNESNDPSFLEKIRQSMCLNVC